MATTLTVNGIGYSFPQTGDEGWGDNVTAWATAVTNGMLQKSGGSFVLTAEVDFGSGFGLKSLYYKSRTSNPASAGQIRLANADTIKFRNAANGADIAFGPGSTDNFASYAGIDLVNLSTAQTLTNKTLTSPIFSGTIGAVTAFPAGTALLPSIIGTSTTTGIYFDASGSVDFASSTTRTFTVDGTGVAVQSGIARFPSGSAAAPTVVGASFSTNGLYFASGTIGFSIVGVSVGTITSAGLTMPLVGQASATAIAAGKIGEEIKSEITSSADFPTTTQFGDLTSISLTTGLWLVSLHGQFVDNAATTTSASFGIGLVSGNSSSGLSGAINMGSVDDATSLKNTTIPVANYYMRLASTTTVYMKYSATYSVGTPKGRGTIRAIRIG